MIYIQYDDQQLPLHHNLVQVRIRLTLGESKPGEVAVYPSVPSTRCLLQPVQFSLESAHMRLTAEDLETFRLLYVHLLLNDSIEERSLHIHLMDVPSHLR